jgi:hypothetical protein
MPEGPLSNPNAEANYHNQRKAMSVIIKLVAPGELSFLPAAKWSRFEHLETKPGRPSPIGEPELPLWKLSAPAVSPKFALIELVIFVFFLTVALVATASCFGELAQLLKSDAVVSEAPNLQRLSHESARESPILNRTAFAQEYDRRRTIPRAAAAVTE